MTGRTTATAEGVRISEAEGRWVLVAAVLASSMVFIDATSLSVAFPALQADLGADGAELLWINNAYALVVASLLLLGGSLGDRFGKLRIFAIGIAVFAAASVLCGMSPNPRFLIVARVAQGLGGALLIPASLALVAVSFDESRRGRAIGTWSAFTAGATVLGPLMGGLLAQAGMWRGVFFINIPLAVGALTVALSSAPKDLNQRGEHRLDYQGAALAVLGLAALNYGLIEAPTRGLSDGRIVSSLAVGAGMLALFVDHQRRRPAPLLPISLFRNGGFRAACVLTLMMYAAFHWTQFFLPLNLIQVQGYSPVLAGLALLPVVVLLVALSRWAGGLVDRHGPKWPLTVGTSVAALGYGVFATTGLTGGPPDFGIVYLPALALLGVGMALIVTPLSTTIIGFVPRGHFGLASGINSTLTRLAGVSAIAVLGPFALVLFGRSLQMRVSTLDLPAAMETALLKDAVYLAGTPVPAGLDAHTASAVEQAIRLSFVDAFHLVSWTAAGMCLVAALVAVTGFEAGPPGQDSLHREPSVE